MATSSALVSLRHGCKRVATGFSPVRTFTTARKVLAEVPGIPPLKTATNLPTPSTIITTLPNGLRVASEDNYGQVCSVGAFIDAGAMYESESDGTRGACHMLENLAFQSTSEKTAEQLATEIQEQGLTTVAAASRETLTYRVDAMRGQLEQAVALLAATICDPILSPAEVEHAKKVAEFQHMDFAADANMQVQEALHISAFGATSPLGRTGFCPVELLPSVTRDTVTSFMEKFISADRMVIAASGVDHDLLVRFAEKHFAHLPKTTPSPVIAPESPYVGGDTRVQGASIPGMPDMTHVTLAFPSTGATGKNLVTECVMDTLLGGGSSFSAGGPGKGMYSRLYREALNRYSWVESASAYSLQTNKVSLVGIYGSCMPSYAPTLVNLIVSHLVRLATEKVDEESLSRARNQLRSAVFMNLELRNILCEDIGRQVLVSDKRESATDLCEKILAVTADDIQTLAKELLSSPVSMAAYGIHDGIQSYESVDAFFKGLNL